MNYLKNINNLYNSKIKSIVKLSILLAILLFSKWKFGLYEAVDGIEVTTGLFLIFCVLINFKEMMLLTTSFVIFILLFYGLYTFIGYLLFFYINGIFLSIFRKFFIKYFFCLPFYIFFVDSLFWIWWIPVDYFFSNFNIVYAVSQIVSGWFVNLIEGFVNFGFCVIFFPIGKRILYLPKTKNNKIISHSNKQKNKNIFLNKK